MRRGLTLPALLLAGYGGVNGAAGTLAITTMDFADMGEPQQVRCSISTTDVNWVLDSHVAAVVVELRVDTPKAVTGVASLHLSALPKREDLGAVEYWAPFAVNGRSTAARQTFHPSATKLTSIRILPSRLRWGTTKSSVWPAREFARAVPPGRYGVRVQIQLDEGASISSNELTITAR
jgi:hypothetical protein